MSAPLPPVLADLVREEPDEPVVADLISDEPDDLPVVMPLPIPEADLVAEPLPGARPRTRLSRTAPREHEPEDAPIARPEPRLGFFGAIGSAVEWCFGVVALFIGLAVLAAVPIGQFLALGYLLEVSGRVARSGRIRDGFIGVRTAARFGGVALAGFLMWLPLNLLSLEAEAAQIIDPNGRIARQWHFWIALLATLLSLHAAAALVRGGRLRHFANPLNLPWLVRRAFRGGLYSESRDRLWNTVVALHLPHYFWLGSRGFVGAFLWLAVPLLLLGSGHKYPLVGFLGGLMLAVVVLYVPFLQVRFARDNRLRAFREFKQVRAAFRRAPLAFAFALWVHLLFAIPLYILKIEVIPRDIVFLEGLLFLLFIFPARLLGGWAYARGTRRAVPRFWLFRWAGRFAVVPVVVAYVIVVFLSQHLGWKGVTSLYEQHAFLLPVPFVAWK
jgi:hypothetical protein